MTTMTDYTDLISRLEKASADHPGRWHGFDDERGDGIHRTITDARDAIENLQIARCELRNALVAVKLWRQTVGLGGSLWDLVDDALPHELAETAHDRGWSSG